MFKIRSYLLIWLSNFIIRNMDRMKHYLTDTTFIAAFTLFSYFLFIQYEKGYLAAFGLADTVGIIPMQIQSIISSVFSVIMATVGLLFIMAVLVAMLRLITKNKSNKIKTASRLVTMLISPLILFYPVLSKLYVQDKKRFYIQMGAIIAEYVFLLIVLPIIRKKGGKDQVEDAIYSSTSIVGRILGKISENKNTKLYISQQDAYFDFCDFIKTSTKLIYGENSIIKTNQLEYMNLTYSFFNEINCLSIFDYLVHICI